uniref:Uncharacterized protein n=1 Tax=Glossina pallidipes TaxID=7398 RepID=A0A1B0A1E1_GLOPL
MLNNTFLKRQLNSKFRLLHNKHCTGRLREQNEAVIRFFAITFCNYWVGQYVRLKKLNMRQKQAELMISTHFQALLIDFAKILVNHGGKWIALLRQSLIGLFVGQPGLEKVQQMDEH